MSPLLSTVRLHPLLVTHNRDYEKTNARWKGLAEVHDVLAECSRYSQDVYEAGSREEQRGVMALWSESSTPVTVRGYKSLAHVTSAKLSLASPPEAAVEATPDNTWVQCRPEQVHHVHDFCAGGVGEGGWTV